MLTSGVGKASAVVKTALLEGSTAEKDPRRGMEQAEIDRVRRALRRRPKPPWRALLRTRPPQLQASALSMGPWSRRRVRLQVGWQLLWTHRLRRDLAPIFRLLACRRGRHHDAHVAADDLLGGAFADDYPELAICEVCGRAVQWPNGTPALSPRAEQ